MNHSSTILAKDIMHKDVLSVYEGWSIQRLADFFMKHKISGAPVIAADHELVGVVSVSDIFHFENMDEEQRKSALQTCYRDATNTEPNIADLENWSKNAQYHCTVHQIMAPHIISVPDTTPLAEIAALMLEQGIHRVFVTQENCIAGVISTTNMLQVLAGDLTEITQGEITTSS
ncbi:MAG: CBS domain-containing protein [Porticoccus sp.]|nr:CBS domain-containing protein [Porticoccus sp.]